MVCLLASASVYLLSVGVAQDVASHYVDEVGFWVDFAHEATKPPPESEQKQRRQLSLSPTVPMELNVKNDL